MHPGIILSSNIHVLFLYGESFRISFTFVTSVFENSLCKFLWINFGKGERKLELHTTVLHMHTILPILTFSEVSLEILPQLSTRQNFFCTRYDIALSRHLLDSVCNQLSQACLRWKLHSTHFLFISNTILNLSKNQASRKQNPKAELLLFGNYSYSSSMLSSRKNRKYSKKELSKRTSVSVFIFMRLYD